MTSNVDAEENVQDSMVLPEPVTVKGDTVQEVLLLTKLMVPAKPFSAATVILEVPAEPTSTTTEVELGVIVKSWTVKVTVVEWDRVPLVPVIATTIVRADAKVHDRVTLPESVTLFSETHEVLLVPRLTTPANPPSPVTEIEEAPTLPAFTVTEAGLALIRKSWISTVTLTELVRVPLVPETVTV